MEVAELAPVGPAEPAPSGDASVEEQPEVTAPVPTAVDQSRSSSEPSVDLAADSDEAGLGRSFVRGSVVGFVVVFVVCAGIVLNAGGSLGAAIGVGAFAGFWGGPGFGGMLGAVTHHSRHEVHH